MPRDSSGNYTLPAGNPVTPNTVIESQWANNTMTDLKTEIGNSLDRLGRGGMLAPFRVQAGTVGAPAFSFTADPDSGLFLPVANALGLAVGGVERLRISAAGTNVELFGLDPSLGFSETDTVDQNFRFRLEAGVLTLEEYADNGTFLRAHTLWTFNAGMQVNGDLELESDNPSLGFTELDTVDENFKFTLQDGVLGLDEYDDLGVFLRRHSAFAFGAGLTVYGSTAIVGDLPYVYVRDDDGAKNLRFDLNAGVLTVGEYDNLDVFVRTLMTWDLTAGIVLSSNAPSITLKDLTETDKNFRLKVDAGLLTIEELSNAGAVVATPVTLTRGGGVQVGTPTGGDKGAGTVNAQDLYINGESLGGLITNSLLAQNGYQELPGGMVIQWGRLPEMAVGATATFTFPIAFTEVYSVTIGYQGTLAGDPGSHVYMTSPPTLTGVALKCETIENVGQPLTPHIVAIGRVVAAPVLATAAIAVRIGGNTIRAWQWNNTTGFGTQYTDLVDAAIPQYIAASPVQTAIAAGLNTTPFIRAWPFNAATGFGTAYANPATLPANDGSIAFSRDGNAVVMANDLGTALYAYPFNATTGFGVKFAEPATKPTNAQKLVCSPAQDVLFVGDATTPFIHAYQFSSSTGFGTKYANPSTLPNADVDAIHASADGAAIAVSTITSPRLYAYAWNVTTGFGTRYTNPGGLPALNSAGLRFSPASDAIVLSASSTPYIHAYAWAAATGFGAKYSDPATLPTSAVFRLDFNREGSALAVATTASPYLKVYAWNSATGFGSQYADPATGFPLDSAPEITFI